MLHSTYPQIQKNCGNVHKPFENTEIVLCQVPCQIGIPESVNVNMQVNTSLALDQTHFKIPFLFGEGEKMHK